jgi:hypothetical protein
MAHGMIFGEKSFSCSRFLMVQSIMAPFSAWIMVTTFLGMGFEEDIENLGVAELEGFAWHVYF